MIVKRRKQDSTSDAFPPGLQAKKKGGQHGKGTGEDIAIGFFRKGEIEPYEIMPMQVPSGFPREFIGTLAEFYCEGFETGVLFSTHPKLRIRPHKGRPVKLIAKNVGKEAANLRQTKAMSYSQIASRLCEKKNEPGHVCDATCANRIRQRAKPFLKPTRMREK
jgi:hypothetical protein